MIQSELPIILSGDPAEAIEAAKRVIAKPDRIDAKALAEIAAKPTNKRWSRIAAIYALGFIDVKSQFAPALIEIVLNRTDDEQCRAHAAEALGDMHHPNIVPTLAGVLMSEDTAEVKRWCIYSLSETGDREALAALEEFAATKPANDLRKELQAALRRKRNN